MKTIRIGSHPKAIPVEVQVVERADIAAGRVPALTGTGSPAVLFVHGRPVAMLADPTVAQLVGNFSESYSHLVSVLNALDAMLGDPAGPTPENFARVADAYEAGRLHVEALADLSKARMREEGLPIKGEEGLY